MKRLARLAAAFAMVFPAVLVGTAQPASAQNDLRASCGEGYYCTYNDAGWRGCIALFEGNDANYSDNACYDGYVPFPVDNRITSVYNHGYPGSPDDIRSFRHPNYVEMIWFVPQGWYYSNVDEWCGALPCNDQASSHMWV
ncbi:peptidase inhibitor family I36 protein [Lentzea sp. NBRC 105346]|uniref:peptidase inhibitor family I36 protein n=1 Tax=Lentzea sp. NBRC 105346 TaxID=3032205 RepID=UPI002557550F|nr:peptidase inhibitor family I36 protein [Lentzea sp. NBRC 105346]